MSSLTRIALALLLLAGCQTKPPAATGLTPDQQVWPCYVPELRKDPTLKGTVVVGFDIEPSGQVTRARIKSSDISNIDLEFCVLSVVSKWKMENPEGKVLRDASFPFRFKPPVLKR